MNEHGIVLESNFPVLDSQYTASPFCKSINESDIVEDELLQLVVCDTSLQPITLVLSNAASSDGRRLTVKDSGNAANNNINVVGNIDGKDDYLMQTNYEALTLMCHNGVWWKV